ncbi:MAG TPA: porin family protein [Chitinophagaceae bacterium]|nr:porin family protein [Chitinophagaceae bacterium]
MVCRSQVLFGVFAGPQLTTAKYSVEDIKQPTKGKYGFHAGGCLKVPFDNHLYFSPALFYSLKGYKVTFNRYAFPPDTAAINNNTSIHTVELSLLLQLDFGDQPDHFFLKGGPSLDFQLGGTEKYDLKTGGSVDHAMPYGFPYYGHYSVNVLLQLGYETKSGFMVFGQFTEGLANINNADLGPRIKHRVIGISIGKYFHRKK